MSNREMIGEMRDSRHIDDGLVPSATTPEWLQGLTFAPLLSFFKRAPTSRRPFVSQHSAASFV
jgi:hypothetical protein